MEEKRR